MLRAVNEFVGELRLGDKLLPWRNANIAWFWVFLPFFVGYMNLLMNYINAKPLIGSIEVNHPSLMKAILYLSSSSAATQKSMMEVIAGQSKWTEGPLWINDEAASISYLLYSDTVQNRIYKWEEGKGFFTVGRTIHTHRAGCRFNTSYCDGMYEPGSNGLIGVHPRLLNDKLTGTSSATDLIIAQHGERALTLLRENGTRSHIATHYNGRQFNSPNDLVYSPEGHLYFTDPPYGLYAKGVGGDGKVFQPHLQQLNFSGIYMITSGDLQEAIETGQPTKNVRLLCDEMSRPNGLAFSPDFSKLYVSNSDRENPIWKVFDVSLSGALVNGRIFYNASSYLSEPGGGDLGVPDGLKVDINGNILASGPGGVLILSPKAELLGRLLLPDPVSNLAFGADGRLYITAGDKVIRLRVRTKSAPRGEHSKRKL